MKIRMAGKGYIQPLSQLIRTAHKDVADRFSLTTENCPKHPSNCTANWIENDIERGVVYYLSESEKKLTGCVALEYAAPGLGYLERLSVLPQYRKKGFGRKLTEHAFVRARQQGINTISIGIIANFLELRTWYEKIGFVEGETKTFPHLPFQVLLMTCRL